MAHELPPLPYDYSALEPYIDSQTMHLHHDAHHATYVKNLNAALEKYPQLQNKPADDLLRTINSVPEDIRTAVRNNGGGHVNHSMFWRIMKGKGGGEPKGKIADALKKTFGSFDTFKQQFNDAGTKVFGSGWVWLARSESGKIQIVTTPNQNNPLSDGLFPIMGNDVWEHAYYLKYNNRRPEYLQAWWNVVNWEEIDQRFQQSEAGTRNEPALAHR
jgi:Fe-Mn family superoxide dismutase